MEIAFVAACLGWGATAFFFTRMVRDLNHGHRLHVASLLNRIQAPEAAVAQEMAQAEDYEPLVLPHDEKSYWDEVAS